MRSRLAFPLLFAAAPIEAAFSWTAVKTGGGGGFIPGIVFHQNTKGVAYARADMAASTSSTRTTVGLLYLMALPKMLPGRRIS
jgi:hypothetical protein